MLLLKCAVHQPGNPNLDVAFPGYAGYQPLGVIQCAGVVMPPPVAPYYLYLPVAGRQVCE